MPKDRDLLPVRDRRYDDYALRDRVRGDVGRRKDQSDAQFAETAARYWSVAGRSLPRHRPGRRLPSAYRPTMAASSIGSARRFSTASGSATGSWPMLSTPCRSSRARRGRRYINYRDLGVRQLGSIYERLLEHELAPDGDGVAVRPNIFARKGSGSYYTPDDLVGLIVEETIGPLVRGRMDAFEAEAGRMPADGPERERAVARLAALDPAEKILELKVCDPAMGSGYFLVSLVDYFADGVIAAMAEAEALAEGYVSPLVGRIQAIRDRIVANAEERAWAIDRDRLDDRHIVRRMVLKRCVYGVDKNPMAVELAKVALWLHTFTVGAPLSFLDHHLRCGDSLFGAWARSGIDKAKDYGSPLLLHGSVTQAGLAALGNADDRGVDRRRDRRGAPLRRDLRPGGGGHRTAGCRPLTGARPRLAGRPRPRGQDSSAVLLRRTFSATPSRSRWAGPRPRTKGPRARTSPNCCERLAALSTRNASSTGRRPSPASGRIGRA